MKATIEQSNDQLSAWLNKTERSAMNMLNAKSFRSYARVMDSDRLTELRLRWEDIAKEMGKRQLTNSGRIPTPDGTGEGEYNFGDATC